MESPFSRVKRLSGDSILLPQGCKANGPLRRNVVNGEQIAPFVLQKDHSVDQVDMAIASGDSATKFPVEMLFRIPNGSVEKSGFNFRFQ
jgi:hypothetical protein